MALVPLAAPTEISGAACLAMADRLKCAKDAHECVKRRTRTKDPRSAAMYSQTSWKGTMGWTAGHLQGPFTARAAIEFDLGAEFVARVVDTTRHGKVIYAAVGSTDGREVFGLVLLTVRTKGVLFTKAVSESMGPVEDHCPALILDQLTEPNNDNAREWRERCRAHLARSRLRPGQKVTFAKPLRFTNGDVRRTLIFQDGARFRSANGTLYHIRSWKEFDYKVES